MDGLLVIDKPVGPTSHDVVQRVRRLLAEPRIGHTGTLDPMASGVLALVLGRATRLARFLIGADKSYEAVVRLGQSTDSGDVAGRPTGAPYTGPMPAAEAIDRAIEPFRGRFEQQPPALSAKKIAGQRSYTIARRGGGSATVLPAPVSVTAYAIDVLNIANGFVTLRIDCSAGFYIRALALALGEQLGTGAHLVALRRIRSGDLSLDDALDIAAWTAHAEGRQRVADAVVPLAAMLPSMPSVALTHDGVRHATQGRWIGPADLAGPFPSSLAGRDGHFRLLDSGGALVAVADREGGLLHPSVVLM